MTCNLHIYILNDVESKENENKIQINHKPFTLYQNPGLETNKNQAKDLF